MRGLREYRMTEKLRHSLEMVESLHRAKEEAELVANRLRLSWREDVATERSRAVIAETKLSAATKRAEEQAERIAELEGALRELRRAADPKQNQSDIPVYQAIARADEALRRTENTNA